MPINIKNGTIASDAPNKCDTCVNALIRRIGEMGDKSIYCNAMWDYPIKIREKVVDCNRHEEKQGVSLGQMYKLAWLIDRPGNGKPIGFQAPKKTKTGMPAEFESELDPEDIEPSPSGDEPRDKPDKPGKGDDKEHVSPGFAPASPANPSTPTRVPTTPGSPDIDTEGESQDGHVPGGREESRSRCSFE